MATATRRNPGDWDSDGLRFGPVIFAGFCYLYPLVTLWLCHKIAIEAMAQSKIVEIVDLPIKHGDFP